MNRSKVLVRLGLIVALVLAGVVLQIEVGLPSQPELRSTLDRLGPWAVPAFVALYVAVCLLPAGPTALLTIAAGALFGLPTALGVVFVGAVLGSALAFEVGRWLGHDVARQVSGDRVRSLDDRVRDKGFATVLVARLVPLLPFTTLNYVFGITSVRRPSYLAGTALGILPGSALYAVVGAYGTTPGSWPFVVAVASLVLLTVVGVVRSRRARTQQGGR